MTIEKGAAWGSVGPTPHDCVLAKDEAGAAVAVQQGATHVWLESGNILRALGLSTATGALHVGEPCRLLPCDVLIVKLDDAAPVLALSSVVIGSWRTPQMWVTTGGFLGALNVAPRAHVNDGLVDALEFNNSIPVRQLLLMRRRMRLGDHLPHPMLTMHRAAHVKWPSNHQVAKKRTIRLDGKERGRAAQVTVEVRPDAFSLCLPMHEA